MIIRESDMANPGIEVYSKGSDMDKKLNRVASFLTAMSPKGYRYYVDDIYFDYGQNWMYTTVIADDGDGGYQALNPRQQGKVFFANSIDELYEIAKEVLSGDYTPDRIR